jgi:hypothetical protein
MIRENEFMRTFHQWVDDFARFVEQKGKVQPGRWRAYGFQRPNNLWKEAKTGLRDWKLRIGWAPQESSNKRQMDLDLNKDVTMHPKKSEGEKLREKE